MISALFFINQKGEVVISRMYRDGVTRSVAETFRTHVIGNKDERSPIKVVGDTVFMYVKHGNMFVVAVASGNAQAAMTFQFLHSVVTVLKSYFGAFDEDSIRNNFVLIYELSTRCSTTATLRTARPTSSRCTSRRRATRARRSPRRTWRRP